MSRDPHSEVAEDLPRLRRERGRGLTLKGMAKQMKAYLDLTAEERAARRKQRVSRVDQ